jgi:hypothetical protein
MVQELPDTDPKEHRTEWLKRLADEYIKLEPLLPFKLLPEGEDCPAWATRVEEEIGAVMLPHAKVKEEMSMTPQRMGALLGHECGIAVWMMEFFAQQSAVAEGFRAKELREEEKQTAETAGWSRFEKWYPGMRRLAKIALSSSVDQSYEDMTDFLLAFSKAFACKPKTGAVGDIGNPTFEIYVFMIIRWRLVAGLKSVRELHDVLVRFFGPHRIGELKRIEKICQRIGLHYRKPGRPKTTAIIQTP